MTWPKAVHRDTGIGYRHNGQWWHGMTELEEVLGREQSILYYCTVQ